MKKFKSKPKSDYFQQAKSWSDDYSTSALLSRNRYRIAFFVAMGLCAIMAFAIASIIPLQRTELAIVHQGVNGEAWVSMTSRYTHIKPNWIRTKSNIAQYVRLRESYDPLMYAHTAKMTSIYNSSSVNRQYNQAQTAPNSPVNTLTTKETAEVTINNVLLIDRASRNLKNQKTHVNLAQVNYTVVITDIQTGATAQSQYRALVSWKYNGIPISPYKQLHDWDGFEITKYISSPVNLRSRSFQ